MNQVKVSELQAGTKFNKPVFVDETNLFVPEDVEIRQKDIERLQKWGVDFVRTEGEVVTASSTLQQTAEAIANILDLKGSPELLQVHKSAVIQTNRVFNEIQFNRQVERQEIDRIVEKIEIASVDSPDQMTAFVFRSDQADPTFGVSAVNCTILAVILGVNLKMDQKRLRTLSTGALLHDIGMVKVPESIVKKKSDLIPEEVKRIKTHTLYSYQIITKQLGYSEEVGIPALQHHERWDGKGYPRALSGRGIALEARIVSVTDAFEAMVREKPYRSSMIGYSAMRQILNDNSRRFDSEILKVFIKGIGIYPVGSFVLLNNGIVGRVIKVNVGAPLRPAIKLLVDAQGQKYLNNEGEIIDLSDDSGLFIARAIDPKAITPKKKG